MNWLFGSGQASCLRSIPSARTTSRSRAWSSASTRAPIRPTISVSARPARSRVSRSGRHGGGLRRTRGCRASFSPWVSASSRWESLTPRAQSGNERPRIFRSGQSAPSSTGSASTMTGTGGASAPEIGHGRDRRRQYQGGQRRRRPHRRLCVGHRGHGASGERGRRRSSSPDAACAISQPQRRSMRCSRACRRRVRPRT